MTINPSYVILSVAKNLTIDFVWELREIFHYVQNDMRLKIA